MSSIKKQHSMFAIKQDKKYTHNLNLMRVPVTIFGVESNKY